MLENREASHTCTHPGAGHLRQLLTFKPDTDQARAPLILNDLTEF